MEEKVTMKLKSLIDGETEFMFAWRRKFWGNDCVR